MVDRSQRDPVSGGEVGAPTSASLASRARLALGKLDFGDVSVVLAVLALCVLIRWLRLQPIEYYEDEVSRWNFVRQWFYPNDFEHARWTHHMARFGVNGLVFLAQLLCGRGAAVYYVAPIASFALQVLFVYLSAKRLGGRGAALLARCVQHRHGHGSRSVPALARRSAARR